MGVRGRLRGDRYSFVYRGLYIVDIDGCLVMWMFGTLEGGVEGWKEGVDGGKHFLIRSRPVRYMRYRYMQEGWYLR